MRISSEFNQPLLAGRAHIQNYSEASQLEPHWGYADRVLPCTSDAGSCAYLDVVYGAHDIGMVYVGILWATILAVFFIWAIWRRYTLASYARGLVSGGSAGKGGLSKVFRSLSATTRHYLLPDAIKSIFGRTTRLQVLILAVLAGYLLIWSFVGIAYNTWITPVKNMAGVYNTRTSLGPWSDRVGVLAYALTPLSVLLASRESIISLITGVPYQNFNFLHRWLGYIIFVQSSLHTIGWCVIEIRLYQPQPKVAVEWITQLYMIWGIVAMILMTLIFVLSTPWGIRLTGYEFFRKAHYVLAMVYIGACWGHWEQLKCFLIPSLILWFVDRAVRLIRTGLLHYKHLPEGSMGFKAAQANITRFEDSEHGDVVRLDFEHEQDAWSIGQHYYLCFTDLSMWQSHPFTPLNAPFVRDGKVKHSYIIRAKSGETKKIAQLAEKKLAAAGSTESEKNAAVVSTPVILTGAYGESIMEKVSPSTNIMCITGGTGITYVLPALLELAQQQEALGGSMSPDRKTELIWCVRHYSDMQWVKPELNALRRASKGLNLTIRVFVTREGACCVLPTDDKDDLDVIVREVQLASSRGSQKSGKSASDSSGMEAIAPVTTPGGGQPGAPGGAIAVDRIGGPSDSMERHPNLKKLLNEFLEATVRGNTTVFGSGPGSMLSDVKSIVAECNSGSKVWKGDERFDVRLICDDRLEW